MTHLSTARYTRLTRLGELEAITISHPGFQAALTLQGAHLVHFAPANEPNWLWLSPTARFEPGRAIRGGIPVCWPWFGVPGRNPGPVRSLLADADVPAHGFARTAPWVLAELQETDSDVTVTLALDSSECPDPRWTGQARAWLRFRFRSDALSLTLTTENTGSQPLAITQALHTYLPTPDVTRTTLSGLEGSTYLDTLDGWQPKRQQGKAGFAGETDRIYLAAPVITVHGGVRDCRLTAGGSASTVVWNPGPEKSLRLSDFPDDGWTGMLCVETANAVDDYRKLASGQSHSLTMTLCQAITDDGCRPR
ncbi:D-hexose-6-phosphate mutarotase [Marinobacter sp.]|uniref:D-hexose-6-phosphate mutarotase n=1 Tax=Marinobacter sp. TaxID=50741 RepID=UPI003563A206